MILPRPGQQDSLVFSPESRYSDGSNNTDSSEEVVLAAIARIAAMVNGLVKRDVSPGALFRTLSLIIIIRTFFEMLLEGTHSFRMRPDFYADSVDYLHFYLSWICVFLAMSLLAGIFLRLKTVESFRLTLFCFPLVISVPFLDFVFTNGRGAVIQYSNDFSTFFEYFANCLNPFATIPLITTGIGVRIEIFIIVVFSFLAALLIFRRGVVKSLFFSFSLYTSIFIFGYLPAIYRIVGLDINNTGTSMTGVLAVQKSLYMYILPFLALICIAGYRYFREDRTAGKAVISFLYAGRLVFYLLLLGFGFLVAAFEKALYPQVLNISDLLKLCSAVLSITLLFVWAKIINDLHDLVIDRISNKERPLPNGTVSEETATGLAHIACALSFVFAVASDASFIFYWLFMWAMSFVYSAPPLRLRRHYPVGHGMLAGIGVSVFLSGGALVNSHDAYLLLQHKELLLYVFAAFFFISHIKDFKDMEGDEAGEVYNGWNHVRFPKVVAALFLSGFTLAVCKIFSLMHAPMLPIGAGALIFLGSALWYLVAVKDLRKLDRLLMLSLGFLVYVSAVWIYQISAAASR